MSWLGTYKYRRKVTVSKGNIDSDLTHFPLLLTLGTSVGTGSTDVSDIFDELASDANRTKIAFTKTDGTTQLYAEIEKWDDANETAVIWISKSDLVLASGATTDVYMYYDSAQSANTTYIGDTNAEVAENVWDSNHKVVQHMADGASTSAVYDSTSNDNDGTKKGAGAPAVTTSGKIGNAQDFDGTDDVISIADDASINFGSGDFTLEAWISLDGSLVPEMIVTKGSGWGAGKRYFIMKTPDNLSEVEIDDNTTLKDNIDTTDSVASGWHYVVGVRDGNNLRIYTDGLAKGTPTDITGYGDIDEVRDMYFGAIWRLDNAGLDFFFAGLMDEVRVSGSARSAAWIKANYYAQTDALVAWGAEEENPQTEFTVTISETITTTEVLARPVNYNKSFSETFSITEALSVLKAVIIDVSEAIGITETLTKASAYAKAFSESLSITETLAIGKRMFLTLVESISITESLAKLMAYSKSKVESFSVTDTLSFVDKYWKELTKHTSSYSNSSKNTSSWTNQDKNIH